MSSNIALEIAGISKCYQIYEKPIDRLWQFLFRGKRSFYSKFWALHPLSLIIEKGECVGFVGRNGSGKSTLLQMIAGTVTPTSGRCQTHGRVAALLELGAGFNPEFTGRENVILHNSLFGLSVEETTRRMPAIEAFAEIGEFIDRPVKTYSSGMYVRLAFAAAIHVDPDILIVDEALAVGDAAFQYKCMSRIRELQQRGMSILFVTHDTFAVKQFCKYAGWLHEGNLIAYGDAVEVANQYEDYLRAQMNISEVSANVVAIPTTEESAEVLSGQHGRLLSSELIDARGVPTQSILTGSAVRLRLTYEVFHTVPEGLVIGAAIFRSDNLYVCGLNSKLDRMSIPSVPGKHTVTLSYDHLDLLPGSYYIKTGLFDHTALVRWDFNHRAAEFTMTSPHKAEGVVALQHRWEAS